MAHIHNELVNRVVKITIKFQCCKCLVGTRMAKVVERAI